MNPKSVQFKECIGSGHFGDAWRARWKHEDVVIKTLRVEKWTPQLIAGFREEVRLLARLSNHPRIVRFCGAVTVPPTLMLATQLMPFGSVYDRLIKPGYRLFPSMVLRVMHDGAVGLYHLHSHSADPVTHCDVAARNLLLDANMRAKGCEEGNEEASSSPPTSSLVIPYPWSAPETLSKLEFSIASDVYMFGCMMYEIVFQTKPW
eukprot:jgi/Bigna1/23277/gw1.30.62.1